VVCGVVAVGCWSAGESEHCRRLGNVLSARLGVPKSSIPHACDIVQFRHDTIVISKPLTVWQAPQETTKHALRQVLLLLTIGRA